MKIVVADFREIYSTVSFSKEGGTFFIINTMIRNKKTMKTMKKDIEGFIEATRIYLQSLSLDNLRCYGRYLQLQAPTKERKKELIEKIIKVLCGKLIPQRNNRGAPVKNAEVSLSILETISMIKIKYLQEATPIQEPVKDQETEESPKTIQVVIDFSTLNKEQKNKFKKFLNSL